MSATKKRLPHGTIPFERITDRTVRDTVMKLNENIVALQKRLDDIVSVRRDVVQQGGTSVSGSDYIEVGDGTGGTTKGQVKAKVPTDGTKGLVTTDTAQIIKGLKSFSPRIELLNGDETTWRIGGTGATPTGFRIYRESEPLHSLLSASKDGSQIEIGNSGDTSSLTLVAKGANGVIVRTEPTVGNDNLNSHAIPTCSWVNKNYKVTELVNGSNITITPDATNPKKLTISAAPFGLNYEGKVSAGLHSSGASFTAQTNGVIVGALNSEYESEECTIQLKKNSSTIFNYVFEPYTKCYVFIPVSKGLTAFVASNRRLINDFFVPLAS